MAEMRPRLELIAGVLIGMVSSFGSQLLWRSYTGLQQSPAINLHFRPVELRVDTTTRSCPINRQRLRQLATDAAFTRPLPAEARFALDVYARSAYRSLPVNAVSAELLDRFAGWGVIARQCSEPLGAPLSLEVAYILRDQVPYVVDRDCVLDFNGHQVPVQLDSSSSGAADATTSSRSMVIRGTDIFTASVRLDARGREAFAEILSPSSTLPVAAMRLHCQVIADDRRLLPVGNARPVPVPIARTPAAF